MLIYYSNKINNLKNRYLNIMLIFKSCAKLLVSKTGTFSLNGSNSILMILNKLVKSVMNKPRNVIWKPLPKNFSLIKKIICRRYHKKVLKSVRKLVNRRSVLYKLKGRSPIKILILQKFTKLLMTFENYKIKDRSNITMKKNSRISNVQSQKIITYAVKLIFYVKIQKALKNRYFL